MACYFPREGKRVAMKKQTKKTSGKTSRITPTRKTSGKKPTARKDSPKQKPVTKPGPGHWNKEEDPLPGYPHYPGGEDIMNSGKQHVGIDIENPEHVVVKQDLLPVDETQLEQPETDMIPGTNADVTEEEVIALGDKETDLDEGDDEVFPREIPDEEMIVPGAELDDASEEIGSEDEENNYYSLGGDNHD